MADGEQPRLDLADRQAQQRQAFLRAGQRSLAGHVEHAEQRALRARDRHRGAGEAAQAFQIVLAAVDLRRPPFHQRRAEGIGAARRLAPAGAWSNVGQATALQVIVRPFDGKDGGVGVGEDDQAFPALALQQVVQLRRGGVQQQAVVGQQHLGPGAVVQPLFDAAGTIQAMVEAAPPGSVDFLAQHAGGQFAFALQLFTGAQCFAQEIVIHCSCNGHASLQVCPRQHGRRHNRQAVRVVYTRTVRQ
ncbi:hypothetical protein D3C76_1003520 [compost metagenome]